MKSLMMPLALLLLVVMLAGCASSGVFSATHITNVELSEGNYQIVATDVAGEATAGYLVGVSAAQGGEMQTIALFRLDGEGQLYQAALADLWRSFENQHGPVDGRSLALINVRYDAEAANYFGLYTRPTIYVRADVIEFGR